MPQGSQRGDDNESGFRSAGSGQPFDAGEPPCAMLMKQGQISTVHGDDALAEKAGSYQSARTLLPSKQGCRPNH
jgi:hypothetical protein